MLSITCNKKLLKRTAFPSLAKTRVKNKQIDLGINLERHLTDKAIQAVPSTSDRCFQTECLYVADAVTQVDFQSADDYKRKILSDLTYCKKRLKLIEHGSEKTKKEQFAYACERLLPPDLAELVTHQCELTNNGRGNRYGVAHRTFSLNLYFVSPKVYRMVEKDFRLPSSNRLKKMDVGVSTDFMEDVLAALKVKLINMTDAEKYCTVAVDFMRLKGNLFYNSRQDKLVGLHDIDGAQKVAPARYALVILVKGILVDWSQPIGFSFLSETQATVDISAWIDKVLQKLLKIGLKIKAYVPNYRSELLDETKIRGITLNQPYFFINGEKIYYIFNVPDLLKQLRNTFLKNDLLYDKSDGREAVAKFEYVMDFYNRDSKRKLRLAEKLTETAVHPYGLDRRPVQFATQLFSRTVATGLATYIDFRVIDDSARDTVEFILLINNLFDILNSSSKCADPYKTAYTGEGVQRDVLNRALCFFKSLRLNKSKQSLSQLPTSSQDSMGNLECVIGFQVTILSVIYLMQELKQDGYNSLMTKNLNLDVVDKFFKSIRSKGDMTVEPTSHQFVMAFRRLYFSSILKPLKESKVCSKNVTKVLVQQNEFSTEDGNESSEKEGVLSDKSVTTTSFNELRVSDKNSCREVCSFLLKRCLKVHSKCKVLKDFSAKYTSGACENVSFVEHVMSMEREFQAAINNLDRAAKVGATVYDKVKGLPLTPEPCPCFPKPFFQKVFIRLRLNMLLNYNNMIYRRNKHKATKVFIPQLIE